MVTAGDAWHPYTFKPLLKRRGRFVGEVLLPLKIPQSHDSAHNRWSTPSAPDSGEYINKTKDNKEKRGLPGVAGRDIGQDCGADLRHFPKAYEGRKEQQDKEQASSVALCSVTSARSAGSYGSFRGVPKWGQNRRGDMASAVVTPRELTLARKK